MTSNMTPVDWARRPIDKYADFTGRAPRAEYWWYALAIIVVSIVIGIVESLLGLKGMILGIYGPISLLFFLGTLAPSLAVAARRLHDTNRSGWWLLIGAVPYGLMILVRIMTAGAGPLAMAGALGLVGIVAFIGAIVLLVFMVLPSQPGSNQYGPNPYGEGGGGPVPA